MGKEKKLQLWPSRASLHRHPNHQRCFAARPSQLSKAGHMTSTLASIQSLQYLHLDQHDHPAESGSYVQYAGEPCVSLLCKTPSGSDGKRNLRSCCIYQDRRV